VTYQVITDDLMSAATWYLWFYYMYR